MRILFIQIGDIHLRAAGNLIETRIDALRRAILGLREPYEACVLVVVGDVAFSGQKAEYEAAHRFLDQLRDALRAAKSDLEIREVFVPGNHDCCLPESDLQVRSLVVGRLLADEQLRSETSASSLIRSVLTAQDAFWDFVSERTHKSGLAPVADPPPLGRLYWKWQFDFGGTKVAFHCYNTAWLSQRHEKPSELLAPVWAFRKGDTTCADVAVTLFHHPYTWLEPANAKALRKQVEAHSDILMTGHEHVPHQYSVATLAGPRCEYFEGAVLQEGTDPDSGFNTLLIDSERSQYVLALHRWNGNHYATTNVSDWRPFKPTHGGASHDFEPTDAFFKWLEDPGATFSHPRKAEVRLSDLFVCPDFDDRTLNKDKDTERIVRGDRLQDYIRRHGRVLLLGDERCGRTSLAKRLWMDSLNLGCIPVLLSGSEFREHDDAGVRKTVSQAVAQQYSPDKVERFWQLDRHERLVIVDDFHQCRLNRRGFGAALTHLSERFDRIVLFANHLFEVEEASQRIGDTVTSLLASFRCCTIRPLGHRLRRVLIEKWHFLGQEFVAGDEDASTQVRNRENLVNTLLGKNVLPSYPLFVLTILQMQEAQTANASAYGAYGYHYEALITSAFHRAIQQHESSLYVGTIYTYVAGLAYFLFGRRKKSFSEEEFAQVAAEYRADMRMRFGDAEMQKILVDARILARNACGELGFAYPYVYYYFVARYLHENLTTNANRKRMRALINDMTAHLHVEEYANVLIFLMYLTKDEETIQTILTHARSLYPEQDPCDLDTHIAFADKLSGGPLSALPLDASDLRQNNEEYRIRIDEAESLELATLEGDEEVRLREDQELDEILRMNSALKTVQVMGQILRNFPGSLKGDLKRELATECYLLGLRTLRTLYLLLEEHTDDFRAFFASILQETQDFDTPSELAEAADQLLNRLVFASSYWMVKTISQAVGSEQLVETYKEIDRSRSPLSIGLIDLSIRLDHFRKFPLAEIEARVDEMTEQITVWGMGPGNRSGRSKEIVIRKRFAYSLLRHLVRDHLYLYPVNYQIRHRVCDKLGIVVNDPRMLGSGDKQLPGKS